MKIKRCAFVAAVALIVCTVAFWQWNRPSDRADSPASAGVAVPLAKEVAADAVSAVLPTVSNQTATVRGTKPYVLTSESDFNRPLRLAAEALGARTVAVRSGKALLIEADPATHARLKADGRFSSVDEFLPTDKMSSALAAEIRSGAKTVDVTFVTLSPADRQIVQGRIAAHGGEVLRGCLDSGDSFSARLPAGLVAEFAACGDVRWMERFVRPHLMNDFAVNPEAMNVRAVWDPHGLTGEGQVVSTSDSGIDTGKPETLHADLRAHIIDMQPSTTESGAPCDMFDSNGHGTHTAGSIVGDGTLSQDAKTYRDGPIRGTAWGAKLHVWFCGKGGTRSVYTPSSCEELFRGNAAGTKWSDAFIHSASWGSDTAGGYTAQCRGFDTYLWHHPDFLPVVSAGNAGSALQTVGSPAAAKNVLSVGATANLSMGDPAKTASFSSRGPCADGRIKPEISSPGDPVTSTRSSLTTGTGPYTSMSGTSMSCPLTAGAVALVREWLVKNRGYADSDPSAKPTEAKTPSAALMKAIVTGGAKGAPMPNNDQGWGRTDLGETLFPSGRAVHLIDRIPFESETEFAWIVETTNAAPFDVQLAWVDYPGDTGSESAPKLVNDLDLTVERLDGGDATTLYGNGGMEPDALNNLESVHIASAEPNRYLVTVNCRKILYDHTEGGAAALYIRGAFDPQSVKDAPLAVRIRETAVEYRSLDAALAEVRPGQTVEILGTAKFRKTCQVANSCTITATNANPWVSTVSCMNAAQLIVTNGVTVTFTNVVFQSNGGTLARVFDGSRARLAGAFGLGRIQTDSYTCLELVTTITNAVEVDCLAAPGTDAPNNRVAWSALPPAEMAASANHLLCPADDERGGVATNGAEVGKATLIVWQDGAPVPEAATKVKLSQGEDGPVNYRSFAALLKHYSAESNAEIRVCQDCPLGAGISIRDGKTLLLVGASQTVSAVGTAGFEIVGNAKAVVSNVTFSGAVESSLFSVGNRNGSSGELVFGGGAVAVNVSSRSESGGGVVCVYGGRLVMEEGSRMVNCRAVRDKANGGAVYLCPGTTLDLAGGVISSCSASGFGGGVYACAPTTVNLSGASAVFGNVASEKLTRSDLHFFNTASSSSTLNLAGRLTGENGPVGIRYGATNGFGKEGDAFATNRIAIAEAEASVPFLLNDETSDLVAAVEGESLVWAPNPFGPGGCEPALAGVRVVYPDGVTNYYERVEPALATVSGVCSVELLTNCTFAGGLSVEHAITLRSAPERGEAFELVRSVTNGGWIVVREGASLTVENIRVDGNYGMDIDGLGNLIKVDGGELALKSGATVGNVYGCMSRADGVITVWNGGHLTMESGSCVTNGWNLWRDAPVGVNCGIGGGILIDGGSTADLRGGLVTGCWAIRGGGVAVANKSTVRVSGDFTVVDNGFVVGIEGDSVRLAANNFMVEDLSSLVLAGDFAGAVGISEGIRCDTNVFGTVDAAYCAAAEFVALTNGAASFAHDVRRVRGVVATNGTENALLVWSDAFVEEGGVLTFTDRDGNRYGALGELPPPLPEPVPPEPVPPEPPEPTPHWEVEIHTPSNIAFQAINRISETEWQLVITDRVEYCNYRLIWTDNLAKGFTATGDWEHAVGEAAGKVWTTNVITTGDVRFWRVEGKDGTNMVLKAGE